MIQKLCDLIISNKQFIVYSCFEIGAKVLAFLSNIFIARQLGASDYGSFSLALMIVGFATAFGFSWSSSALIYYGSKERAETGNMNKTFWARNIILFFSLIIITLIFIVFRKKINLYIGQNLSLLILGWLYIRIIQDYIKRYFLTIQKQRYSSSMIFVSRFLFLILVLIFSFNVKTLIIFRIISDLTIVFYLFSINKKDIGHFEFDKRYFKEILSFSLWQLFGFSGLYIINFGDNAVIKHFMTTTDVGIYNAGYKLFNSFANLSFLISSFYAAEIVDNFKNKYTNKLKEFYYKKRFYISGAIIIIHFILIMISKKLVLVFYGKEYLQSGSILQILLIGSLFKFLSVFYVPFFNGTGRYKIIQSLNIFQAILNIILDIILIKYLNFGLAGPALGTVIAIFIKFLLSFTYCENKIKNNCFNI